MVSIIITPQRVESIDPEGRVFTVRRLSFERGGIYRDLHDGQPFVVEESLQVQRLVRTWSGASLIPLSLPVRVLEVTGQFLTEYHGKEHLLDCYDFATLIAGLPLHDKSHLYAYWREQRRIITRPGDVIFLVRRRESQFRHAAIYLGHGLYLSVYGRNGDLEITGLREMKKDFGANDVLKVIPRIQT